MSRVYDKKRRLIFDIDKALSTKAITPTEASRMFIVMNAPRALRVITDLEVRELIHTYQTACRKYKQADLMKVQSCGLFSIFLKDLEHDVERTAINLAYDLQYYALTPDKIELPESTIADFVDSLRQVIDFNTVVSLIQKEKRLDTMLYTVWDGIGEHSAHGVDFDKLIRDFDLRYSTDLRAAAHSTPVEDDPNFISFKQVLQENGLHEQEMQDAIYTYVFGGNG